MIGRTVIPHLCILSDALSLIVLCFTIMSGLKSVKLVRGTAAWTLTRFSDSLFIAKNGFGKKHVFRSGAEMTYFEDFLLGQGFAPIVRNRSLETIKRPAVA